MENKEFSRLVHEIYVDKEKIDLLPSLSTSNFLHSCYMYFLKGGKRGVFLYSVNKILKQLLSLIFIIGCVLFVMHFAEAIVVPETEAMFPAHGVDGILEERRKFGN